MAKLLVNGQKHRKIMNIFSMIVIIITLLFLVTCILALVWPYKVIEVSDVHMVTKGARIGESLMYAFHYHKFNKMTGEYVISLVDGAYYNIASGMSASPAGEFDRNRSVLITQDVPPGLYHIEVKIRYKTNPIRTVLISYKTRDTVRIFPAENP